MAEKSMKNKSKVTAFLSHSSADKKIVRRIQKDLTQHNVSVWLDEERIKPGQSIPEEIQNGLRNSDYLLLFLTPRSVNSGWVKKEWETRFFDQVNKGTVEVIPLLIENCDIPEFLKPIKYVSFVVDYEEGITLLLKTLNENLVQIDSHSNIFDSVADILDNLSQESVTLPFAGKIPVIQTLKRLPRSGKHLRLNGMKLTSGKRVPSRSLYDHILSVAHSADTLFNHVDHGLDENDEIDLARCIAFHEVNEILLGDIPSHTDLSDRRRHKTRIDAESRLRLTDPSERERVSNEFISMFLNEKQKNLFLHYIEISQDTDSRIFSFFKILDKIDPIIGVWRYIHTFRGQFSGGSEKFVSRMHDFFDNPWPNRTVTARSRDPKLSHLVTFLQKKKHAIGYHNDKDFLDDKHDLFGLPAGTLRSLIEGKKLLFVEQKHLIGYNKNFRNGQLNR